MLGWLKRLRTRNEAPPMPAPAPSSDVPAPTAAAAVPLATPLLAAPGAPLVVMNGPVVPPPPAAIPHDKIVARAYEIWVRKGKPHGQDLKNWEEAEAELRAEFAAQPNPEPLPRKSR